MVAMGLLGGLAHLFMIYALKYAEASFLSSFFYQQIIWMVFLGWMIFGDMPDFGTVVGSLLIIITGIYLWFSDRRSRSIKNN